MRVHRLCPNLFPGIPGTRYLWFLCARTPDSSCPRPTGDIHGRCGSDLPLDFNGEYGGCDRFPQGKLLQPAHVLLSLRSICGTPGGPLEAQQTSVIIAEQHIGNISPYPWS